MKKRDQIIYKSLVERASSAEIRTLIDQRRLPGIGSIDQGGYKKELADCSGKKIKIITCLDGQYPTSLRQTPDFPAVLYCRGNTDLLNDDCLVAMVGSRRATSYGLTTAKRFSAKIATAGAVIVSGMALGIDSACHRGALSVGGKTIAVLGTAIDNLYPKENEALGRKIITNGGCVVSEYPPGFWTSKFNFPMRNRIIAGLSQATVVVEAARNSGALITAGLALDYNRDLYAVPSDVDKISSQGANLLLLQGANCLISPSIIIDDLGLSSALPTTKLTSQEREVVEAIRAGADNFDKITNKLNLEPSKLSVILATLEIKGQVKKHADKIQTFD